MYILYSDYTALYGDIEESTFNRLGYEACRMMDDHTTGIDGIKKLKKAYPQDEDAIEAVKYCAAKLVNLLHRIQEAEAVVAAASGYIETEQGLQRKIISRIEAGTEAISYTETQQAKTTIDVAVANRAARDELMTSTIREYLSGVTDSNGINLLYMGQYPRRFLRELG